MLDYQIKNYILWQQERGQVYPPILKQENILQKKVVFISDKNQSSSEKLILKNIINAMKLNGDYLALHFNDVAGFLNGNYNIDYIVVFKNEWDKSHESDLLQSNIEHICTEAHVIYTHSLSSLENNINNKKETWMSLKNI